VRQFFQDLTYALRLLRRQPGFTAAAVAALALGIGCTTAVFSVIDAVVLRPFPFPDPDRIVMFENTSPAGNTPNASPAKFAHYQRQADVVHDAAAFRTGLANYTGGDIPEQLRAGQVSASYFRLLGAKPIAGRTFAAEEDRPNGPRVAVLSYGWWQRRFGGAARVIGSTISLNGEPYSVIGVTGPGFDDSDLGQSADLWTPLQLDPNSSDQGHYFITAGRLQPGVTLAQAQARLKASVAEFRQRFPDALEKDDGFTVEGLSQVFLSNSKSLLTILLAAVGGVLLIACANVASLLLVRATVRRREMVIRAAIGAGRGRIVSQLMTESIVLAILGGLVGMALGVVGVRWLLSINAAGLPRLGEGANFVHPDWRVFAFTSVVSILVGCLFGAVPAVHASREDLNVVLREGSGASASGRHRTRSALVVLEITLAVTLVIGSGLLIRASMALQAVPTGFDPTNVLTMRMAFTGKQYESAQAVERAIDEGTRRVRALPGVADAGAACCLPLQGGYGLPFKIVGRPLEGGPWHGNADWFTVSPGYFEALRIPLERGRAFSDRDEAGSTPVVIINETMAKQFWKKGDPLHDRLTAGRGIMKELAGEPDREIIGVVGDSHDDGLNQTPQPKIFTPEAQTPDAFNALSMKLSPQAWVIRTRVPPMSLSAAIQGELRQATGLPVSDVRTMDQIVSKSTSRTRFNMLLMTIFAASALTLASIGIYGVMAYAVQQRTREIGVRLALGAEPGAVRDLVMLQGIRLTALGVALGLIGAYAGSRYLSSLLFGVEAHDPAVFVGVPVLLTLVSLAAAWIPARRASNVDPLVALRAM
jgi:predicted permease